MFAWFSKILASVFGVKFFMAGILMTVLGIVLYNFVVGMVDETLTFAVGQISGVTTGTIVNPTLSGFAGWFFGSIKLPEAFSVMVTCVSIKFVLRKIPFLNW
jgi:hypothetical protein